MMWPSLLIFAHFLIFTLFGVIKWQALLLVVWVMVSFNFIWLATGLYLSLRLKKATTAVVVNLLIAVFAYAVVFVALLTITQWLQEGRDVPQAVGWCFLTHTSLPAWKGSTGRLRFGSSSHSPAM